MNTTDEMRFCQVLQLEALQWHLETQDRYNVYTTNKAIAKETKAEFLNDVFQKAMRTGSYKDFSALHLRDLKVSIFKEFRSKVKNTIRNLMHRVLKKEPSTKESLIENLKNVSKDAFDAILKARVPRYKLDQVFAYLQKKAKKENRELPPSIVDSFIKKSILGPSMNSKLVENSFLKNIKEAIDTIMKDWASTSDQDKEETIKRFELLLGQVFRYTDFYNNWMERRRGFSKKLLEFMHEIDPYASELIKEAVNNKKATPDFKHIMGISYAGSEKMRKEDIGKAENGLNRRLFALDEEEYLALLREDGEILRVIPHEKHTREMVLTAINNSAWAIFYAAPRFQNNKEMIAAAFQSCKRLLIIPLFRAFIPRGNRGSFKNDVLVTKVLHIEAFIKAMKLVFYSITLNDVKKFFLGVVRVYASFGRDVLHSIKALLKIPQNLYTAITNITPQQIEKILSDIFTTAADMSSDVFKALNRGFNELVETIKNIPNGLKYFLRTVKEAIRSLPREMKKIVFSFLRTLKNLFDLNNDESRTLATLSLSLVAAIFFGIKGFNKALK